MIYNFVVFWGQYDATKTPQYDDLVVQEIQYSPRLRRGKYCTSKVAKSSYLSKK